METLALVFSTLAGILAAGVVGYHLGLLSRKGEHSFVKPEERSPSDLATKQDLREWQLEMEDLHEKVVTLFGRIEKRRGLAAKQDAQGRVSPASPDAQHPPSNRERALAKARASGVLALLAHPTRHREDLDSGGD